MKKVKMNKLEHILGQCDHMHHVDLVITTSVLIGIAVASMIYRKVVKEL